MKNKQRDPEMVAVGRRIRAARLSRGLTLERLSEAADTSIQFISQLERGEQAMTMIKFGKLARALGVSSDYLLFGRDQTLERTAIAAEYLGRLNPIEQDLVLRTLTALRGALDELAPEHG